jgi:ubiquitin carboxyl-terminal hydrolase 34
VIATHLALVDKCLNQLVRAAGKLKAFSDGTSSGEDEPMVIVASEAEVGAEELCFSRSLMFLRGFIQGIRNRPEYVPGTPQEYAPPSTNRGDLMAVRYQLSEPDVGKPVLRVLQIGELETCLTLKHRLAQAAGLANFKTIVAGRTLDLEEAASRPIRDTDIRRHPILVVKRPGPPRWDACEAPSAVEDEILKHFDDLYDLLGLEERYASQVGPP